MNAGKYTKVLTSFVLCKFLFLSANLHHYCGYTVFFDQIFHNAVSFASTAKSALIYYLLSGNQIFPKLIGYLRGKTSPYLF